MLVAEIRLPVAAVALAAAAVVAAVPAVAEVALEDLLAFGGNRAGQG
jgi:hypothetical protein